MKKTDILKLWVISKQNELNVKRIWSPEATESKKVAIWKHESSQICLFAVSMPLSEQDEFLANERKTIDPRTAHIEWLGTGLLIKLYKLFVLNVLNQAQRALQAVSLKYVLNQTQITRLRLTSPELQLVF